MYYSNCKIRLEKEQKFYVGHIQDHSNLPGPLSKGNYMADALTRGAAMSVSETKDSHELHHQNALALRRMFHITTEQVR